MATDIDLCAIAKFSSLSQTTITSLLDTPTSESVKELLQAIERNAKECEQNKTQKVKLEVELETVVRTNESKVKVLQNSRDKALSDVQKLRSDLQASETGRTRADADLEQVRSNASSEATELINARSRISSLEASNRDILTLLDSKTNASDSLSKDLSTQHQKAVELRKQIATLEQTVQASQSAASNFRFKEQSLQQEIDLLKKSNEWLENERKIKADEHSAFRKEKNARLAELTRNNEQYISEAEAAKRSESAMRRRLEDQVTRCEDLLQDLQRLQEEKAAEADAARAQIENITRLQQLQETKAATERERVNELNETLQEKEDEFNEQLGEIRAAAESDHAGKEAAEARIVQLETTIADLRAELDQARLSPGSPQHPVIGNGAFTPSRPSTPLGIFTPSTTSRMKGNMSQTQFFAELKRLEKENAAEKREKNELQEKLDDMVQQLETYQPELEQMQADHARVQSELLEMSSLLDAAMKERDVSLRDARNYQGQLDAKVKEVDVLTQSLRDMGAEIRYLLMEQEMQRRGDTITKADLEQMQSYADEAMELATADLSQTQRIVNEKLIIFKDISELQQLHENQVTTIRNLVTNLEEAQSEERQRQYSAMEQDLLDARNKISSLQDEIKGLVAQSKSFMKERNMFREMLSRKGHLVEPPDFARSLPLGRGSPAPAFSESANGVAASLKEAVDMLQQQYDAHREETSATQKTLRSQIDGLTKRNSELQTEASRVQGQIIAVNQRSEMLQANFDITKGENSELTKRISSLMEAATKQDLRVQQVAEEAVEARSMIDSLRRESANLRAEKDLWKTVESRLLEETESLRNERGRVDQLNSSLQNLLNEREQSEAETRRRLQSQAESLETELQSVKRRLNDETEENRKVALRREYEQEQNQKRIADLMAGLSSAREELVAAKTSRDHLQARVDELTVELRSSEERVQVLTRPVPSTDENEDESISKEQELALEISELKRDLDLKSAEIERLSEQIEVYKSISQSSEERLQELTETNDQYRQETDSAIAEKDAKIKDLAERVEEISSELRSTNADMSKVRDEHSESARKLEEQKTSFENEINRLKNEEEILKDRAQYNLEATKEQARIAIEAQQNYESEVVKHGEAAKMLQTVRSEANQLRLDMVDLRSQAESAQKSLEQKESSWTDMKARYEKEITDLKKRRQEIQQQNTLLQDQLEKLMQQITSLQKNRTALLDSEAGTGSADILGDLPQHIKFLRQEKEIVEVQLRLSTQEANRLRQQLDFTKSRLDETQLKLDQQLITEIDSERNAASHTKLMETLTELNVFRESSVTLRAEAKQAQQGLAEKTKRVAELEEHIQSLSAKVAEFEHLAQLRADEMKILQEDRDRWQNRTESILSKYNRVDPAEIEAMKEQLTSLESERDEAVSARDDLQAQVDRIPDQIKAGQAELRERLGEQFKSKVRELNGKIKDKQAEVDELTKEKNGLVTELDFVKEQLESAKNHTSDGPQVNGDGSKSPGEVTGDLPELVEELQAKISGLESALMQKEMELSVLEQAQEEKFKAKESELKGILNKRLAEIKQENTKALEEQKERLSSEHQQELEALRAQSIPVASEIQKPSGSEQEGAKDQGTIGADLSDESIIGMNENQARLAVQKNPHVNRIVTNNIKKRIDPLKKEIDDLRAAAVNRPAADDRETQERIQSLEKQLAEAVENAEQEKESALSVLKDNMEEDFTQRMSQQKLEFDEEAKQKIAQQVANAESMASKKAQVQINMAQGRLRNLTAQIEVVKKAAEETPDRGVGEVWMEAKVAKPAPAPAAQVAKPPISSPVTLAKQDAKPATTPAATPVALAATSSAPAEADSKSEEAKPAPVQPATTGATAKPVTATATSGLRQPSSGLPRGAASSIPRGGGRGGAQAVQPQQPAANANRAPSHTGIPRGGGFQGRGRGGRASMQLVNNTPGAAGSGRGGATSARTSLSGGAQPFVPGGKRARDDGDGNDGQGKRIRGGGQGS